jgi:hypothetical protein
MFFNKGYKQLLVVVTGWFLEVCFEELRNKESLSFDLDKYSMKAGCKHPSPDSYRDTLRVTVRLSVVEVCFR